MIKRIPEKSQIRKILFPFFFASPNSILCCFAGRNNAEKQTKVQKKKVFIFHNLFIDQIIIIEGKKILQWHQISFYCKKCNTDFIKKSNEKRNGIIVGIGEFSFSFYFCLLGASEYSIIIEKIQFFFLVRCYFLGNRFDCYINGTVCVQKV